MSRQVCEVDFKDPAHHQVWTTLIIHDHHLKSDAALGALVREAVIETLVKAVRANSGGIVVPCARCGEQMVPYADPKDGVRYHCPDLKCPNFKAAIKP